MARKAQNSNGSAAPLDFEAELWAAADTLRGNIESAEYKHVVLGLIFLKYVSDAFEEQRERLKQEAAQDPDSGIDPEDPEEYRAKAVFYLPQKARWSFLRDNARVPSLFRNATDLADRENQFPVLPPPFPEAAADEYVTSEAGTTSLPMNDAFDAFNAARAWFAYSLTVVPPPKTDATGQPLPWASPRPDEYDAFRYRMPRSPALIIFRQQAPRAAWRTSPRTRHSTHSPRPTRNSAQKNQSCVLRSKSRRTSFAVGTTTIMFGAIRYGPSAPVASQFGK